MKPKRLQLPSCPAEGAGRRANDSTRCSACCTAACYNYRAYTSLCGGPGHGAGRPAEPALEGALHRWGSHSSPGLQPGSALSE